MPDLVLPFPDEQQKFEIHTAYYNTQNAIYLNISKGVEQLLTLS